MYSIADTSTNGRHALAHFACVFVSIAHTVCILRVCVGRVRTHTADRTTSCLDRCGARTPTKASLCRMCLSASAHVCVCVQSHVCHRVVIKYNTTNHLPVKQQQKLQRYVDIDADTDTDTANVCGALATSLNNRGNSYREHSVSRMGRHAAVLKPNSQYLVQLTSGNAIDCTAYTQQ